jgi:hypothetical protein
MTLQKPRHGRLLAVVADNAAPVGWPYWSMSGTTARKPYAVKFNCGFQGMPEASRPWMKRLRCLPRSLRQLMNLLLAVSHLMVGQHMLWRHLVSRYRRCYYTALPTVLQLRAYLPVGYCYSTAYFGDIHRSRYIRCVNRSTLSGTGIAFVGRPRIGRYIKVYYLAVSRKWRVVRSQISHIEKISGSRYSK